MAEAIENTIPCDRCNKPINLKDWSKHIRKCLDKTNYQKKENENKSYVPDNDVTNTAAIPCEFCENLIPIDTYDSHWRKCSQEFKNRNNQQPKISVSDELIELSIPCEYCTKLVSAHEFEKHTRQCANGLSRDRIPFDDDDLIIIPCEYCQEPFPLEELQQHTENCTSKKQRRVKNIFERLSLEPSNELIPCEYCDRSFSAQELTFHEICILTQQNRSSSRIDTPPNQMSGAHATWPEYWDGSATKNLTRYIVDLNTEEYDFVANNFRKSLPNNQIVQIERIQNRRWYRQYDAHKDDFIERYGTSTEQWLFHGCRQAASAEAIIQDCFNRSHAVNCAVGQGIYFATQSAISLGYTSPDPQGLRHMFMARVLVGRTTRGSRSTRVCPPGFDTTGTTDVFVTYHDAQAYGQYLITFR